MSVFYKNRYLLIYYRCPHKKYIYCRCRLIIVSKMSVFLKNRHQHKPSRAARLDLIHTTLATQPYQQHSHPYLLFSSSSSHSPPRLIGPPPLRSTPFPHALPPPPLRPSHLHSSLGGGGDNRRWQLLPRARRRAAEASPE